MDSLAAMGCCYWIQDGNNDNNQDNDIIKINPLFGSGGSLLFWFYCDFLLVPIKCYANEGVTGNLHTFADLLEEVLKCL